MPNFLPIPHHRQQHNADCLASCAAMVLADLKISIGYDQLLKLLKVRPYGTAGQNLKYLQSLGVKVVYREGSLAELKAHLKGDTLDCACSHGRPIVLVIQYRSCVGCCGFRRTDYLCQRSGF